MTQVQPPMLLELTVTSVTELSYWPNDGTTYANYPFQWTIIATIVPQSTSSQTTPTPFAYTGTDVVIGDWISTAVGGFAWIIRSITNADETDITCVVEDVNQYNTYADPSTNGFGAPSAYTSGFIFTLDESDQPILTPTTLDVLTYEWQTDLMGRFASTNPPVTTALTGFEHVTLPGTGPSETLILKDGTLEWAPTSTQSEFIFTQTMPLAVWNINHNMNMHPSIEVVDESGDIIEGDIAYVDANNITLTFAIAIAGFAYLN